MFFYLVDFLLYYHVWPLRTSLSYALTSPELHYGVFVLAICLLQRLKVMAVLILSTGSISPFTYFLTYYSTPLPYWE